MNFVPAITSGITKYATFTGEARRSEYWWWALFTAVVMLVLSLIDGVITGARGVGILSTVWALAVLLPSLAVAVRRLRDAGHSWTLLLVLLIPILGMIILFLVLCQPSTVEAPAARAHAHAHAHSH